MDHQNYCLKWKKQMEHLQSALADNLDRQLFCDVTLASEDQLFSAHQFVLSACSQYFRNIFDKLPTSKHPVICLNDVSSMEIKTLFNYMYKGQTVVSEGLLPAFLKTCERLQIQGLCNTRGNFNNQNTAGLKKTKHSRVKKTNRVVFENNSLDRSNQEQRVKKRKTNALEQGSADNAQVTCENGDSQQSLLHSTETNKVLGQTHLINRDLEKKRQNKQSGSSYKQTKHTHVTSEICFSKQVVSQENSSSLFPPTDTQVGHSKNRCNNNLVNTDSVHLSDDGTIQENDVTQDCIPGVTIDNINNNFRSNGPIHQSDVFTSSQDSQESFAFSDNFVNIELHPVNVSPKSVIIQNVQQDIIEISDDGTNMINTIETGGLSVGNIDSQTNSTDNSESMIVQLDINSQKENAAVGSQNPPLIVPPDNIDENQESDSDKSDSDESEIIIRRKSKRLNRNLSSSSDDGSNESRTLTSTRKALSRGKQRTHSTREGTSRTTAESLKTEALSRAKSMRIIISKK